MSNNFTDLLVWQKAIDMVVEIYKLIITLPVEERYALCDQMRRCSVSIPSNIAEGQRRNSKKEFIQFLSISRGSTAELQTQLLLCQRLRYAHQQWVADLYDKLTEIDKMLSSLIYILSHK